MKYEVTYNNRFLNWGDTFEDAREAADYIMDHTSEDVYDEMLDECYEEIEICGLKYSPSVALYRVDEVAYNEGKSEYFDSLASDIAYTIERMDADDEEDFYNWTVTAIDDEEEEEEEEEEE